MSDFYATNVIIVACRHHGRERTALVVALALGFKDEADGGHSKVEVELYFTAWQLQDYGEPSNTHRIAMMIYRKTLTKKVIPS